MKATAADGTVHDFPDDTPDSVVDLAMKRYAISQGGPRPMSGPAMDSFFTNNALGRVLDAFGQGAANQWGPGMDLRPEDEKFLQDMGLIGDFRQGHQGIVKAANDALFRTGALVARTAFMGIPTVAGAFTAGMRQIGEEVGLPGVGEAIGALPELAGGLVGVHAEVPPLLKQGLGYRVIGPESQPPPPDVKPPTVPPRYAPIPGEREPILPFEKGQIRPSLPGPAAEPEVPPLTVEEQRSAASADRRQQELELPAPPPPTTEGGLPALTRGEEEAGMPQPRLPGQPLLPAFTEGIEEPGYHVAAPDEPAAPAAAPKRPTDTLTMVETNHVDEQGNVKLDTLKTAEDVNRAIDQSAKPSTGREPAPSQVEDLADALGVSPRRLAEGDYGGPEEIEAKLKLLVDSADDIHEAAQKARANPEDANAALKFTEALDRHHMIQSTILGEPQTPKVGPQLETFQTGEKPGAGEPALTEEQEQTIKQIEQQQQAKAAAVAAYTNSKQVNNFTQRTKGTGQPTQGLGARINDMILEFWINGLLSGLATHTTYAIGNTALLLFHIPETFTAGLIGKLHGGERVLPSEALAGTFGLVKGIPEGIIASWEAGKSGLTVRLPGEAQASFAFSQNKAIPGLAGEVVRIPQRGVAGIHSFNRMIGYVQNIAELSWRAAAETETIGSAAFFAKVKDFMDNPTLEMMEEARGYTTKTALMSRGGPIIETITQLANKVPPLKFALPFVQMAGNAVREGLLERTPAGIFLSQDIRNNLMGRNGAVARDTQIARIAVGTAIGTAVINYAMQGTITGGGPVDYKEAAVKRMTGWQPYSFRLGDTYYSYRHLGPLAQLIGTFADGTEIAHEMSQPESDKVAGLLTSSIAHSLIDETWLRTPAEAIMAIEDSQHGRTDNTGRFIRNQLSSFLPFSVAMGQTARATDPYEREARSIIDTIKSKIPGKRESLLPRRDIFGEPIPTPGAFGGAGVTAIYETQVNNDPVLKAMQRVHVFPAPVGRALDMGGVRVELTDEQHDDYARIAGRTAKLQLDILVGQPGFDQITPYMQSVLIDKVISSSRQMAGNWIKMMYPSIVQAAIQTKQEEFGGALKPTKPVQQR
jgi:hypothetical protein